MKIRSKIKKMEKYINKIIQGDVKEVLKKIPDNFVDMVITSPPYWSLRNYDTEPTLWDEDKLCQHIWKSKKYILGNRLGNKDKSLWFDGKPRNSIRESNDARATSSDFCCEC